MITYLLRIDVVWGWREQAPVIRWSRNEELARCKDPENEHHAGKPGAWTGALQKWPYEKSSYDHMPQVPIYAVLFLDPRVTSSSRSLAPPDYSPRIVRQRQTTPAASDKSTYIRSHTYYNVGRASNARNSWNSSREVAISKLSNVHMLG